VKFAAIADWADQDEYPVAFMCEQLEVSRSGYYAWRGAPPSARATLDELLTALIVSISQAARGNPGVRRVRAGLAAAGHRVSHKRVHRLMRAVDLQGRHPKAWKRTTIAGQEPVPAPDLIGRVFTAEEANTKWCGDITYIKTWDGWAYLATVIDLHSRAVVGWAIDEHMRTDLVTDALDMAITSRQPPAGVIFHSDRGTQGGFDRSSQHLDRGGVQGWRQETGAGRRAMRLRGCGGSGVLIGRCGRRCAHRGDRTPRGWCSVSSGS
jgi:putative transposase